VAEIADEMMMGGQIPPFLIVATESTDADPYGETINDELIPFVDSAYSTRSGSQNRAIAGASLGGVGAYRIFFGHPGRFGSLAVFGSGVMPGEETQVRRWIDDFPAGLRPRVFLNTGEEDVAALRWAQATKGMLDNAGIETRSVFTSGRHTYAYWVSNFADYFLWLADAW
jgi:enterochelin esterase-like enzyme